ncbi:MAG: glycosyltransferase family 39 protein [Candidatus Zixiibacteriota bacterium]
MKEFIRKHPLATVLSAAIAFRLLAVIFSKGYMASDDHFQTVTVAYRWLQDGFWGPDGYMNWKGAPAWKISRFPLYTVMLWLNMKILFWMGFESLDKIMYGVRFTHALFSLIGVVAVYRTVEGATRSRNWATLAGLVMAVHFAMPFLAVRNLIEMFGGSLWALAIYFYYRYRADRRSRWLIWSAVTCGLAWMFRFQLIFAFWIVPFVLLYEYRKVKPALYFTLSLLTMLLIAGLTDWIMVGKFMGTTINHVHQGLTERPPLTGHLFIYLAVIAGYFIPPISVVLLYLVARKRFWQDHLMLTVSTLSFILIHSLLANKQERFMIPVLPAVVIIFVLVLQRQKMVNGFPFSRKILWRVLAGFTVIVNFALLTPFTLNYGHKGLCEPLAEIERRFDGVPMVLFFSPDKYTNFPLLYGGYRTIDRQYVYAWDQLGQRLPAGDTIRYDYLLLYPLDKEALPRYVDSLSAHLGPIEPAFHVGPSTIDYILHLLNPKHNRTNEVWAYRPAYRR